MSTFIAGGGSPGFDDVDAAQAEADAEWLRRNGYKLGVGPDRSGENVRKPPRRARTARDASQARRVDPDTPQGYSGPPGPSEPDEYIEPPKRQWGSPEPEVSEAESFDEAAVRALLDKLLRGAMSRGR